VLPTGFEPVDEAMENLEQDALLPAIALAFLGFVIVRSGLSRLP
jgi:hypothetical protein